MYLFEIASRHMTWLAERQTVTAANIANSDTPGYQTRDIAPFSTVLASAAPTITVTSPLHMTAGGEASATYGTQAGGSWASSHSGNNVSIERELMTASSNSRMMNLDASLARSFHRMLLSSVKA